MSFKVVNELIKTELAVVQRDDGSQKLYMRKRSANGKYDYKSLRTTNKIDAKQLALELYKQNVKGEVKFKNDSDGFLHYATLTKEWFENRNDCTQQHKDLSIKIIDKHLIPFFGFMQMQNIKAKTIIEWVNYCHKQNKTPLSKRTIEKRRDALLAVFKMAERTNDNLIMPKVSADLLSGTSAKARPPFTHTEINTIIRRALIDYKLVLEADADITVKDKKIFFDAETKEYKIKYTNSQFGFTAKDIYEFYNFILFAFNSYVRSGEWNKIQVKHCRLQNLKQTEIDSLSAKAKESLSKRDSKYAKYECLVVDIVSGFKSNKHRNLKRVFFRGAVDCYKRLVAEFKLKKDDYLFFNQFSNRKYAHRKMSNLFNAFLMHYNMKFNNKDEARTLYSLRHSGITTSLLANVNELSIAKNAATSAKMIEQYYSSTITNEQNKSALI